MKPLWDILGALPAPGPCSSPSGTWPVLLGLWEVTPWLPTVLQPAEAAAASVLGSLGTVTAWFSFLLSIQRPCAKASVVIGGKVSVRAVDRGGERGGGRVV